ncbi:MAG: hypothetical protein Tsb009_31890 [Planctomycetaceae bacterium]
MLSGCHLFEEGAVTSRFFGNQENWGKKLPRIPRAANTLKLELLFVERPADDPLLKDDQLWEGVDTVGDMEPLVRKRLLANGIRVGLSSSTPNRAVETLLGLEADRDGAAAPVNPKKLSGRRIVRPDGGETVVQVSHILPESRVSIVKDDGVRVKDFALARCVMRIKIEQLQEGWAKLDFLPEIHHGRHGYRPVYSNEGLKGTTSQNIYRLYSLGFPLKLNVGEMAILTSSTTQAESVGGQFFLRGEGGNRLQRVLIVRLVDIKKSPLLRSSGNHAN